jgi:hypothetical protein
MPILPAAPAPPRLFRCGTVSFANIAFLIALFSILTAVELSAGPLTWTGDEPRYVYQGLGLYTNHSFFPAEPLWRRFVRQNGFTPETAPYLGATGKPLQVLSSSFVYGAALGAIGLEGARWLNFALGCCGIALLFFFLRSQPPSGAKNAGMGAALAVTAISLSLPFIAYQKLLYPETLLFVTVAVALSALLARHRYLLLLCIVMLPFVHTRALPLSVAFAALLLLQMRRAGSPLASQLGAAAFCALGLGAFLGMQIVLFGSTRGASFATYEPSSAGVADRLGISLFDVRHGAIAYSPIFLIGFAGLAAGAIRRDRACAASCALLICYVATFMWATAGESWAARYWVAALPFIAVGLAYWLRGCRGRLEYLPALPLAAIALLNTASFATHPNWFLESRRGSIPYAALFEATGLHPGLLLPIDGDLPGLAAYTEPVPYVLAFTAAIVALLALRDVSQNPRTRAVTGGAALVALGVALSCALASAIPRSERSVYVDERKNAIVIRLPAETRLSAVQFNAQLRRYWAKDTYPSAFRIECLERGSVERASTQPGSPLLVLDGCSRCDELRIFGSPVRVKSPFFRDVGDISVIRRRL